MLQLTTLNSLRTYFGSIANAEGPTGHKDITGFLFGGEDVAQTKSKSLGDCVLWVEWYNPSSPFKIASGLTENFIARKQVKIAIIVPTTRKSFQDKETAYDFCEAIIKQIYARMYLDKSILAISMSIDNIQMGAITADIGGTEYTGCALDLEFIDNTGFAYDATKWN